MTRRELKSNVNYLGDLRHAISERGLIDVLPVSVETPVRVYDAATGTESYITEIYVEDGVLCFDTAPTGTISEAV